MDDESNTPSDESQTMNSTVMISPGSIGASVESQPVPPPIDEGDPQGASWSP